MTIRTMSWGVRRNLAHMAALSAEEAWHWLKEHYFSLVCQVVLAVAVLVAASLTLNNLGWKEGNVLLGVLTLIGAGAYAFQPAALVLVYGANRVTRGATPTFTTYTKVVAHILLFVVMYFLVMATLQVESLIAAVGLLLVLSGMGIATQYLWHTGQWYRTTVLLILTIELVLFAYQTWVYVHPQQYALSQGEQAAVERRDTAEANRLAELDDIRAERDLTVAEAMEWNQLAQAQAERTDPRSQVSSITREVTITDLGVQQIDGVPAGWYTLSVKVGDVYIDGVPYVIASYLRVNGKSDGERVYVSTGVPVILDNTFAFPGGRVPMLDLPQKVVVEFIPTPF